MRIPHKLKPLKIVDFFLNLSSYSTLDLVNFAMVVSKRLYSRRSFPDLPEQYTHITKITNLLRLRRVEQCCTKLVPPSFNINKILEINVLQKSSHNPSLVIISDAKF